jgi:hypothetical protein
MAAGLSLFLLHGCSCSRLASDDEDFVREEFTLKTHAFLDSSRLLVGIARDSVFSSRGPLGEALSLRESLRFFILHIDSSQRIDPLAVGIGSFTPTAADVRGNDLILDAVSGLVLDVSGARDARLSADGLDGAAFCARDVAKGASTFPWFSVGPGADDYLLTCRDGDAGNSRFFLLSGEGKASPVTADAQGQPWLATSAVGAELWGAFLAPDSSSVYHRPLRDSADAGFRVALPEKLSYAPEVRYFHTWKGLWMVFAGSHAMSMADSDGDWVATDAAGDNPLDDYPIRFDGAKLTLSVGNGTEYDFNPVYR